MMTSPRTGGLDQGGARWALLVLPACFLTATTVVGTHAGPFWMWYSLDPDYFYLLDALNLVNLTTPGHIAHPGVTVDALGALVLWVAHPGAGADAITQAVLAAPESHLRLISALFIGLNAAALLALGAAGYAVFGNLLPALILQTGPFLSMVVFKQGYHVKPEALLIFATLMLCVVTVLALGPGVLQRRRLRLAAAFGVVVGFGVATKVTFVPLWLLPVFLLGSWRAIGVYGALSLISFIAFTIPAIGAFEAFFEWMTRVALASDVHGRGAATVIDFSRYPASVLKLFARPVLHVVFLASVVTLAVLWWRGRRGHGSPGPEIQESTQATTRALAGVCAAQLAQVLLIAKQPSAIYMVPSLVLAALAAALLYRLLVDLRLGGGPARRRYDRAISALLALLAVAQVFSVVKMDRELAAMHAAARALDNDRFKACARIYFVHGSSPSFAFYMASHLTGQTFAGRLAERMPPNDFWLENWWRPDTVQLRDWKGPRDLGQVLDGYPCAYVRGTFGTRARAYLARAAPGVAFDSACSTGKEFVYTLGADCAGRVTGTWNRGKRQ